MSSQKFLEPWMPVSAYAENLVAELRREIGDTHPLFGVDVRAIAQRADCDDVLFEIPSTKIFAVVHLTWSGRREEQGFLGTCIFHSLEDWVNECMIPVHNEYMRGESN